MTKPLPANHDAEDAVLGSFFVDRACYDLFPYLNPELFSSGKRLETFHCLVAMASDGSLLNGEICTPPLLAHRLPHIEPRWINNLPVVGAFHREALSLVEVLTATAEKRRAKIACHEWGMALDAEGATVASASEVIHSWVNGIGEGTDSWRNVALDWSDERTVVMPSIGRRDDGEHLLTPGKIGFFVGPPESAKSLAVLHITHEVLARGGKVQVIDFEADADEWSDRILEHRLLDKQYASQLRYMNPDDPTSPSIVFRLRHQLEQWQPDLVVWDGLNAMLGLDDLDTNNASQVSKARRMIRKITPRSSIGIIVDHVTKAERGISGPMGSQAKLGLADWVISFKKTAAPVGRGRIGAVDMWVAKDRKGTIRDNAVTGEVGDTGDTGHLWGSMVVDSDLSGKWIARFATPDQVEHTFDSAGNPVVRIKPGTQDF